MTTTLTDSQIIDALGGTSEAARLCEVQPASVSEWRKTGIPKARLMFIRLARPEIFQQRQPDPASHRRKKATAAGATPESQPQ